MNRINLSELSLERLLQALERRIINFRHNAAWYQGNFVSMDNKLRLQDFIQKHQGQRCFILGNGPSLAKMDLSPLKNEITFGLNRIYLLFDALPFTPTYYVSVNELVLEQFSSEIAALSMPKFLNWNSRKHFVCSDKGVHFLRLGLSLRDRFNFDIEKKFYSGGTVTYVAMQLAYIMGFSEVILIGVDHSFIDKGMPNKTEVRASSEDKNHFHPDYFPKGSKWQFPDLQRSEIAYSIARQEFEKDGRRILDATVDGKLTVFKKVEFGNLFF